MNIDLTAIVQAVIGLIAALVTYRLIPWIRAQTSESQQALLLATTRTLVFAAEQIYGPCQGKKKLEYVQDKLFERGFAIDLDAIEAMVRELAMEGGEKK